MNIIINGGTSGIGREVAVFNALFPENRIIVTGRRQIALDSLRKKFKNIETYRLDLEDFAVQADGFRDFVTSKFENVDILINMAGYLVSKNFDLTLESEARKMMEINFFGPALLIRELKPLMKTGSHIVNISSMGGFQGSVKFAGLSYYSASKSALSTLSECLAGEFSGAGICVNVLALGAVQTEMLEKAFPGYKAPVNPKEIAEFISDFARSGHRFINGKVIPVATNNP
jgi:NAD(P)-dependent dehydrogenase (short-subunit alcohol dehydrogenase family)